MSQSQRAFGETVSPTDTIAAILASYPFSIGLLRELIQNSDDAKATKQVFVLDRRSHPRRALSHPKLAETQGPALLAYNDALFSEADWDALQSIHRSSKKLDTTTTGKYGIGFRASYHITDTPQILSGESLAILDPHHAFSESGGTKYELAEVKQRYPDQLTGFGFFLDSNKDFTGSVIRLPLRTEGVKSLLSNKVVQPKEIRTLFDDFIREELGIVLLFLRHVQTLELHEIDAQGTRHCLASVSIRKAVSSLKDWEKEDAMYSSFTISMQIKITDSSEVITQPWRLIRSSFAQAQTSSLISYHLGTNARPVLAKHKLFPDLGIAVPLFKTESIGRLFTFLPLPIRTGFPCHIHGLFALTSSRQNLTNNSEVGIVRGSDDSILVEWNQTLFDTYIPKTWAELLPILHRMDKFNDLFSAWPPVQPRVETGDSTYWRNLPRDLLSSVVAARAAVWPLVSSANISPEYVALDKDVFLAGSSLDNELLGALARVEIKIVQPPQYLLNLMESAKVVYEVISPEGCAERLKEHIPALRALGSSNPSDCLAILQYLLLGSITSIVGLPIVPVSSGQFVALSYASHSSITYTTMEKHDFELFNEKFDSQSIVLHQLPARTDDLFRLDSGLNLAPIGSRQAREYLGLSPNPVVGVDLSRGGQLGKKSVEEGVDWLSRFWCWLREAPSEVKVELLLWIKGLYLIPSRDGTLLRVGDGIFVEGGLDAGVVSTLEMLGLTFVHPRFTDPALVALRSILVDVVKYPTNVHQVLDQIRTPKQKQLGAEQATGLFKYFSQVLPDACRNLPLEEDQRLKLRSLPIFPTLLPSTAPPKVDKTSKFLSTLHLKSTKANVTRAVGAIPETAVVHGISSSNTMPLPVVDNTVFLDGSQVELTIINHLHSDATAFMTNVDILSLALDHFCDQSRYLQGAFMEYMVQNRESVPPRLLKVLEKAKFVPALDGSLQSPDHIVDPKSSLPSLFFENTNHLPKLSSKSDSEDDASIILKQLRALGLLRDKLTAEIIIERVRFISSSPKLAKELAVKLLEAIFTTVFDCSQVEFPADCKWLPTNRGMFSHEECLDRGSHRPELFDEVLPVLEEIQISPSLRHAFGWDKPLATSTLIQQFSLVTEKKSSETAPKKLRSLIKELAQRKLTDEDIEILMTITSSTAWVPISSNRLSETPYAVFNLPFNLPGFYEIPRRLTERDEVRAFLARLGCAERPSVEILSSELLKLASLPPNEGVLYQALQVLKALPPDLSDKDRDGILVPDMQLAFKPVPEVFYNDLGDRAYFEAGDHCLAHPLLDDQTARKLRMKRLGLNSIHLNKPGVDMGEKLTTTIRNVLKQYTDQQMLTEFLANASDAGADEFKILLDDSWSPTKKLLTPQMATFQTCSSLIVYNNSVFSQKDFDGILAVGTGGKEGKTNTIGQFGLGALSMFHFTELAMILSGDKVLFLDPSKSHLPFSDWASLLIPLSQMQRLYPDHLQTVDGLFDYRAQQTTFFPGTIFRLPLRNRDHIGPKSILKDEIDPRYVAGKILRSYWKQAQHSLLYTKIKSIETFYRNSSRFLMESWILFADRVFSSGDLTTHTVQMSGRVSPAADTMKDEWKVVTSYTPITQLPPEFTPLIEPHRLRSPIVVGLAACMSLENNAVPHNLFSTLPLPMTTTLPVHLTASFILTPDRRHVRFDDYDNLESKYNRWLLSTVAPPAYLYLLEIILKSRGHNSVFWPGNTTTLDPVTRYLVDSFYTRYLPRSQNLICTSMFDKTFKLSPCHMVMLGAEPPLITKVLSLLPNPRFVRLPSGVRERCLGYVQTVDKTFLMSELRKQQDAVRQLYQDEKLSYHHIQCLVDSLLDGEGEYISLSGLPLLPLADDTLTLLLTRSNDVKTHYAWKPQVASRKLFNPSCLVHPDFDANALWSSGYNVSTLSSTEAVLSLVKQNFTEADVLDGVTHDRATWVINFWEEFTHFPVRPDMQAFPFVPTTRPGHFVSINACYNKPTVLVTSHAQEAWLRECFDKLGASVVLKDDVILPQALRDLLQPIPIFTFAKFVEYMQALDSKASFLDLDKEMHIKFAGWARNEIVSLPQDKLDGAKTLPIWTELRPATAHETPVLRRANDVRMLPYLVPIEAVSRFVKGSMVEHNDQLMRMGVAPLTNFQLYNLLQLPKSLTSPEDQSAYRQLITKFMADTTFDHKSLLLPNGNALLVPGTSLYARHSFFVAAFGDTPENFLLDNYRDLEAMLAPTGLKGQTNLDLETFIICARAINGDTTARDRVERALVVFQTYCQDLPLRLDAAVANTSIIDGSAWKRLEDLRFIPSAHIRQTAMRIPEESRYVRHLPDLISPKEVLRPDLEGIAWTQRALFMTEPHSRIMISNPTLGTPTTQEVVDHLLVLALQVARDHPSNRYVLSDLEATYKWLDDHQDEAEDIIINYHDKPLFLNVDDPKTETWEWNSADEMFFNILDVGLKPVRKFLEPFRDLLMVAGVEEIVNPIVPIGSQAATAQAKLSALHLGFNLMRIEGKLTDVVFVTSDEPEQRFLAHRVVLAPLSEYLRDLFCGEFTEAGPASAEAPIEMELDFSGKCVNCILDHLYTGEPLDLENLELADALDALELSQYWGLTDVNESVQINIIEKKFITPVTFEEISLKAQELDAKLLLKACEFFEEMNKEAILRLRGEFKGPRRPRRLPKKDIKPRPFLSSTSSGFGRLGSNRSPGKRVKKLMHRLSSSWSRTRKPSTS